MSEKKVKFYARVAIGYRITVSEGVRRVLGLKEGEWLEVEIKHIDTSKKKEAS